MTQPSTAHAEVARRDRSPLSVLVAVDGSPQSAHACEALAALLPRGAAIHLLTVVSYGMYPFPLTAGDLSDQRERVSAVRAQVERTQAVARGLLESAGFLVTTGFRYGSPPDEILAELAERRSGLVVLGRRALSGPARWLGSVSDRVLHGAHVPVLLVP